MWSEGKDQTELEAIPSPRSRMRSARMPARWTVVNGVKTYMQDNGKIFASPAMKVIDVSAWQGDINWNKVKSSGIDAAILRLGYCNNLDKKFERNLKEVRRLHIPYGIYLFSYAPDAHWANIEANFTVQMLKKYNMADMTLPVYYDLEDWAPWSWNGKELTVPTSASAYEKVSNAYTGTLTRNGYGTTRIYTYLNRANTMMNTAALQSKIGWIAQYNTHCDYGFPHYSKERAWQYSSSEPVSGINGNVDMSAFEVKTASTGVVVDGVTIPSKNYTGWITHQNNKYWFDSGRMAKSKEVHTLGKWYWFDANGTMAKGVRLIPSKPYSKWVYYDIRTGEMQYGEQYLNYDREHTGWYYFAPGTGEMLKGIQTVPSNGGKQVYYHPITGIMQYGEQYLNYDREHTGWYNFAPGTGKMAKGVQWVKSNGGKWVYYHINTGKMQYGEQYLNYDREHTGWYYFAPGTGKMAHGNTLVNGRIVYYDSTTGKKQ